VPIYQASTTLLINEAPNTNAGTDYNSVLASERIAQTYAQLLTQRMVSEQVLPTLPYSLTTDELKNKIGVNVVQNTQLIKVTAEDPNPLIASWIANNVAHVFSDQVQVLQSERY
jgi:capsular polysaccharide biosynthesis protein